MIQSSLSSISEMVEKQRRFYSSHMTKDISYRIKMLKRFRSAVLKYEDNITEALHQDLHKSPQEAYLTEISIVLHEISLHLKHLRKWSKPSRVKTPLHLFPSRGKIIYEPLGVSLIISPWNYPFNLLMSPLVGAISAGCCAMLKPSPHAPVVAGVMEEMIKETFDPRYIGIVQGGRSVNEELLSERFDLIFFTGSPTVGKAVMRAAAEKLTPVILELGGKSPCIVDKDADIGVAAKRIAWGKTINAGQTCIAPDYLLVHSSVKEELLSGITAHIEKMYGTDIKSSPYYPRIVNNDALERLQGLMRDGRIIYGGEADPEERFIAPTVIDEPDPEHPVMQGEIFGPILPVVTFKEMEEAVEIVNSGEKPLAFYFFGKDRIAREVLKKTTSGGGCINDTILHVANYNLPFGGVGNSGMGRYHGQSSFMAFSNKRSVLKSPTVFDNKLKYPPFRYFKMLKKFV